MRTNALIPVVASLTFVAGALITTPAARAAVSPEAQCQKARYDAKAKYDQCQAKAFGQHFVVNDFAKLNPVLSKCRVKYTATWVKIQKKALGTASTCDDNRFVVDNGYGTVRDNLTGLQWEKKTDDGTIHDKDTTYNWAAGSQAFLANDGGLNNMAGFPSHFAERADWRLPTVAELQTILSEEFPCATSPCIDAAFGPTVANDDYWALTELADNPNYAWGVFFGTGEVSYGLVNSTNAVRAVRGGL